MLAEIRTGLEIRAPRIGDAAETMPVDELSALLARMLARPPEAGLLLIG